ncbi:hypothetical protein OG864_34240 [Streptomyces sp. NBC_00124]|uniref:DUF7380 domain-containing protein n=1 Tax=Streptomyces sp. NBC_00124 TaxID=2975662 RepID=UPI002252C315|nr:hypothetical protein [Streptomyces sp. NBC_00124]MCX5363749.1 hypothetical protein [Streptomyces sp. NBC_00124]
MAVVDPADEADEEPSLGGAASASDSVYHYDPSAVPALARLADMACDGVAELHEVSTRVRRLAENATPAFDQTAVRELTITFAYTVAPHPLGASQPGADLVPLEGPSIPRALRDAEEGVRELWRSLALEVKHPVAKARCADVVFALNLTRRDKAAEKAVQSYLELVGGSLRLHEQSDGLLRAWGIARSIGLSLLLPQVGSAMLDMAEGALNRQEDPYVVVHLLDAMISDQKKKGGQSADSRVDDLIDRALLTYTDTHTISEIASLVRRRAAGDIARVQHANEVEVKAHLNDADKDADALVTRFHLNGAASKARQYNLPTLEALAVSRLQSAPPVQWKTFETEVKIPNSLFRSFLRPFNRADTWEQALGAWFNTESPSGDHRSNEATARNVLNRSVFTRIVTTMTFGHNDLPKHMVNGDDEVFQHELAKVEMFSIRLSGILLADALDLIRERFGIPPRELVEDRLIEAGSDPALARILSKSLMLYWVGEFEASLHLAVPKVEAAVRALLLELNEPMYRVAVGDGTGVFPGLGVLLEPLLEKGFDPDWERFLRTFLLGDGGQSVRNLAAHGFMDEVNRETAALALRACALLVLIASDESVIRDRDFVMAALANPLPSTRRTWWQRTVSALRAARRELLR